MRILIALAIAIPCIAAAPFITSDDRVVIFRGVVAGETREWLTIECRNAQEWKDRGFDPSYTHIIADYKPMFRKLPSGQWEICFTSELAENIP